MFTTIKIKPLFYMALMCLSVNYSPIQAAELLSPGTQGAKFFLFNTEGQREGYSHYFTGQTPKDPKATIVSFWTTSCIPCRKEMPALQKFAQSHPKFRLVFINLNPKKEHDQVEKFMKDFQVKGTVLLDFYQTAGKNYGVCQANSCSVPALFLLDPKGQILLSQSGYDPEKDDIEAKLLNALKGGPKLQPASADSEKVIQCLALKSLRQQPIQKVIEESKLSKAELKKTLGALTTQYCQ